MSLVFDTMFSPAVTAAPGSRADRWAIAVRRQRGAVAQPPQRCLKMEETAALGTAGATLVKCLESRGDERCEILSVSKTVSNSPKNCV